MKNVSALSRCQSLAELKRYYRFIYLPTPPFPHHFFIPCKIFHKLLPAPLPGTPFLHLSAWSPPSPPLGSRVPPSGPFPWAELGAVEGQRTGVGILAPLTTWTSLGCRDYVSSGIIWRSAWWGCGGTGTSCTPGGTVNWCSHCGKEYGVMSKNQKCNFLITQKLHCWEYIQRNTKY